VLAFTVETVLAGRRAPADAAILYSEVLTFQRKLKTQGLFIDGITAWRQHENGIRGIRAQGQFLYVGEPIADARPAGLADAFRIARKRVDPLIVTQDRRDFLPKMY
jgi:hypothetical protein